MYNYDVYNLQNTQFNFSVPTILKTFYSTWPFAKLITITQIAIIKTFQPASHCTSLHLNTCLKTHMVESNEQHISINTAIPHKQMFSHLSSPHWFDPEITVIIKAAFNSFRL